MIPYPKLGQLWPAVCDKIGLKHSHPAGRADRCPNTGPHPCPICFLPEMNQATGPRPEWPPSLAVEVDCRFRGDLRRLACRLMRDGDYAVAEPLFERLGQADKRAG